MPYSTFEDLVQEVVSAVGEVEGTSVQTYSQPRVEKALRMLFSLVFRKAWWPQYCRWNELTLDGTLGVVTTNELADVKDFRDFRVIIPAGQNKPIPKLPYGKNPFEISGTKPLYFESLPVTDSLYTNRKLQFWPKTAIGGVVTHARLDPTIVNGTTLYIDENILINGAAWVILEDEDINPNAAQLKKELFEEFYTAAIKSLSDMPMENPSGGISSDYLSEWQHP
jgi:hypothetical protein